MTLIDIGKLTWHVGCVQHSEPTPKLYCSSAVVPLIHEQVICTDQIYSRHLKSNRKQSTHLLCFNLVDFLVRQEFKTPTKTSQLLYWSYKLRFTTVACCGRAVKRICLKCFWSAECGFKSQSCHLCPWARLLTIVASLFGWDVKP